MTEPSIPSTPDKSGEPATASPATRTTGPYTIWATYTTFRKSGFPVMGTMGSYTDAVVVMRAETFKRLVAENPCLAAALFNVGTEE